MLINNEEIQTVWSNPQQGYPGDPVFSPPEGNNGDSETLSLAFLISLSVTFGVLMVLLIIMAVYVTFCNADESDYDEEMGAPHGTGASSFFRRHKNSSLFLDGSFITPGKFDDEQAVQEQEDECFKNKFSKFEIELYQRAKEFQKVSPPIVKSFGTYTPLKDKQLIKDRGIQSYYFLPSINDNVDKVGNFLPSFLIQDKLDIEFTKYNKSSSAIMNFPLPYNRKDAVYFEVKVFKYPSKSNSIFTIGLITPPYPYFRMPGYNKHSLAYESTGKLRISNPFYANTLLPKLEEGDVVGFGYRFRSGTIFITHNGKKLLDLTENIGVDLFIGLGAMNACYTKSYTLEGLLADPDNPGLHEQLVAAQLTPESDTTAVINPQLERVHDHTTEDIPSDEIELQVNLGQLGFVFIEANVKKYAFGSVYGEIGIPPSYNGDEIKQDTVLQKGEELPPEYPAEDMGFFGNIKVREGPSKEQHAMDVEHYERASSAFDRENNVYEEEGTEEMESRESSTSPLDASKAASGPKKKNKKRRKRRKGKKHIRS